MKFYGEVLVFVLLLITNLRVFFVNHVRRDPLVALAPLTFIITILQLFSWGVEPFTILGVLLGLLVFLSNFHAMFRYGEKLYIDHYSPLMKTWAVFTILLSSLALAATIYFRPVELQNQKIGVTEKVVRYKGNFRSGFKKAKSFTVADAILREYKAAAPLGEDEKESKALILFIPDKRADTLYYKPYLQLLAKEGYTVYSGDFYADDLKWLHSFEDNKLLRRLACLIRSLTNNQKFMSEREFYTYNIFKECQALLDIVNDDFGTAQKFYMITDVMGKTAISDFYKKNGDRVLGIFSLDSLAEYKTAGYGCIEQTDPLLAAYFGIKRDFSLASPKLMVGETVKMIKIQ